MKTTTHANTRKFSALTETQRVLALKRFRLIRPFLKARVSLTDVALNHQLSVRTLRRWVRQYRFEGLAGLIKQTRKDQGRRRSVGPALQQIIEGLALQKPRRTITNIQRETLRISQERTPQARWEAGGFLPRMPESLEQLDLLLLHVAKTRRVQQDGIHFQGLRYFDLTLAAYVGEDVLIRYDPHDQ